MAGDWVKAHRRQKTQLIVNLFAKTNFNKPIVLLLYVVYTIFICQCEFIVELNALHSANYPIDRFDSDRTTFFVVVIYQFRISLLFAIFAAVCVWLCAVGLVDWRKNDTNGRACKTEMEVSASTFSFVEFMNYLLEMSIDFKFRRQLKWGFYSLELKWSLPRWVDIGVCVCVCVVLPLACAVHLYFSIVYIIYFLFLYSGHCNWHLCYINM